MAELSSLKKWFEARSAKLSAAGISYSCFVEKTETDNPASTFHLEADRWRGNISLWESGACNLESIKTDVLMAEPIFEHRQIQSEQDLHTLLSQVFHL